MFYWSHWSMPWRLIRMDSYSKNYTGFKKKKEKNSAGLLSCSYKNAGKHLLHLHIAHIGNIRKIVKSTAQTPSSNREHHHHHPIISTTGCMRGYMEARSRSISQVCGDFQHSFMTLEERRMVLGRPWRPPTRLASHSAWPVWWWLSDGHGGRHTAAVTGWTRAFVMATNPLWSRFQIVYWCSSCF